MQLPLADAPAPQHPRADRILAGLDPAQHAAVTSSASPLAILAPAGSGKTRVLTRRIAYLATTGAVDAGRVLAVTFTRKAAGELRARLGKLDVGDAVTAGTLHAIALAQLTRHARDHGQAPPNVLERKARLLVPLTGARGPEAALAARDLAGEIEWAKARLVSPRDYAAAATRAAGREPAQPVDTVAKAYARYEVEKRRRGVVDFDDLVTGAADVVARDDEAATDVRRRIGHLFVDEFQDTTPAQLRLLRAWLGDRHDLTVVGDPDQAIYGFSGADPSALLGFVRAFPGGQVLHLDRNYRSTPEVIAAASALLADGGRSGADPARTITATRPTGPLPTLTEHETAEDEARDAVARARAAHATGQPWHEVAVLYRTNAQSAVFEEAFTRGGVPYRVRGAARFLERDEVRAALEQLRRAVRAAPARNLASHLDEIGEEAAERVETSDPAWAERAEHVTELVRLGHEYLAVDADGTLDGFHAHLRAALRDDLGADGDGVQLLTFHRAKGLEFRTVLVTGLERGFVPIAYADTPEARAEERRLLYVAMTRAIDTLHLGYARQRTIGVKSIIRTASPWVAPLREALDGLRPQRRDDGHVAPARLREARGRLARAVVDGRTVDDVLLRTLVEWRRNTARAANVPAYVVFSDATLREVASTRPRTRTALLAVSGIGSVKAERYGDAVLDMVRRHPA